jgi:hypothetical protein
MLQLLTPFVWVGLTLPILLLMQRWIHRHLHGLSLLATGKQGWAIVLYALILLPGVLLHELSHWISARLMGVRTGKFSVIPRQQSDGSIQLGYVEYFKTNVGPVRESIIGGAPLVAGTLVILLIGFLVFDMPAIAGLVQSGGAEGLRVALLQLFNTSDFLVWLYLLFAIGNAMMPSPSDRRGWPMFGLMLLVLLGVALVLGLQNIIVEGLLGPVAAIFGYLGVAFSLVIGVDAFVIIVISLLESLLSRLKQVELVYEQNTPQ